MASKRTKYGGRQKGTPNKLTFDLRASISEILDKELISLPKRLEWLSDKERLDVLIRLLPYVIPKMSEVNTPQVEPRKLVFVTTDKDIE
jgi:hypothetical protein